MKNFFKFNWINGLGLAFIFTAFLYFLKIAVDNGWLPPTVRAAVGLTLGVSALFVGLVLFKKNKGYVAQSISALGIAIVYATIAYVSFSESIAWSPNALLISMVAISLVTSVIAVKNDMRVLYVLSTLGALATPLIIKASETQDLMLFIYLLIINVGALYVSAIKKWHELKIVSFVLSLAIYTTYYVLFNPIYWIKPFLYIGSLFLVYIISLTISSWNQNKNELGIDQYLGVLNAISFVFWSTLIFKNFHIAHTVPMIIVSALFIALGALFYFFKGKCINVTNGSYLALGVIGLCIACSDTGLLLKGGMNYVVNSSIWLFLIVAAFIFGKAGKNQNILLGTYGAFVALTVYWYIFAWNVEWVNILGFKYIPFLNAGALVWIALAFSGFYFSNFEEKFVDEEGVDKKYDRIIISNILGVLSHLIVGGLITVQISNLFTAYQIQAFNEALAMSVSWMIYALILFLWSNKSDSKIYRIMGIAVLLLTSLKIFIFDLSGAATFQKVLFLLVIGGLTLLIGKLNKSK